MFSVENEYGDLKLAMVGWGSTVNPGDGCWSRCTDDGVEAENDLLVRTLREYGVEVLRPTEAFDFMSDESVNPLGLPMDLKFIRDTVAVVGDVAYVIGGRLSRHCIRPESYGRVIGMTTDWCLLKEGAGQPFLEGGDIIVDGSRVYVGISNHPDSMSNMDGCRWLQEQLMGERKVIPIRTTPINFHLDQSISLISEDLAVVTDGWAEGPVPDAISERTMVGISREASSRGLANGLCISRDTYLIPSDYDCFVELERILSDYRVDVVGVPFRHHLRYHGGIRCSTLVFERMS